MWIPLLVVLSVLGAYLSKLNSENAGWRYGIAMYLVGMVPIWVVVSKFSRNLLFDGMLFDTLLFVTYALTFCALGVGATFTPLQWFGCALMAVGGILLRVGVGS